MSMIGHNNPPKDRNFKNRWARALLSHPGKPAGAVAMGFKLYLEMDASGEGAVVSDSEFVAACGVSERSCQNFKRWLIANHFVRIQVKGARGRSNVFKGCIPDQELAATGADISAGLAAINAGKVADCRHPMPALVAGIPATGADNQVIAATNAVNLEYRHPMPATGAVNQESFPHTPFKESNTTTVSNNNITPLGPPYARLDGRDGVSFKNGKLAVINGVAAQLAADFPAIDIQAACDLAADDVARADKPSAEDVVALVRTHAQKLARKKRNSRVGTKLSPDWKLPRSWGEWALEHYALSADKVRDEAESFRDYWVGLSGAKGVKSDWAATWRNWIRNSKGRYRRTKTDDSIAPDLLVAHSHNEALDAWAEARRISEADGG